MSNFRGEVVYNAEQDIHFPHLTVGQTLKFAALARTPENRLPGVSRDEWATHVRDVVMASFGLLHTLNTKVGDDFIRGVSGGERKRVSIAEVVLSSSPLQCWDNSTRGLDSATALEFIKYLKIGADLSDASIFVSLYQASQDAYDLFDKVTVLYEGRQIYFGSTKTARQFFENMGYMCVDRQTTADFLTSLTSPSERVVRPGFEHKVPRTADEFAAYWEQSQEYRELMGDIAIFNINFPLGGPSVDNFRASRVAEQAKLTREKSPYNLSFPMQVSLCTKRGFQRLLGDMELPLTTIIGNTILAFIFASVFYNTQPNTNSFFARGVIIFFSVLFNALTASVEILSLYMQRPIVEKQSRYAFYHPSAEAISSFIVDLPCKILSALGFNIVLYFLSNLRREAGPFFIFFLFAFLCTLVMSSIFRTMSCVTKSLEEAMTPATMLIIVLVVTTGFVIPPIDIPPWIKWLSYINPMSYAYEAMMVNEFRHRQFECSAFVPSGPGYENITTGLQRSCTAVGSLPGYDVVEGNDYLWQAYHYLPGHLWRNLGIVIAFFVFFSLTYIYAAETMKGQQSKGEVLVFPRGHKSLNKIKGGADDEEAIPEPRSNGNSTMWVDDATTSDNQLKQLSKGVFQWRNVCYDIKIKGEPRRILNQVDGWVQPGTLTALMGASGAGKTTLLDVLANRATVGVISGEMLVNGNARNNSFQRETGYVQQQDIHLSTSTVREALEFSAVLRQSSIYTRKEKIAYVDEVIRLLEMEAYADAVVGVPGEGLNIEQRKRLTIGVELAARPDLLLFLDEPTSGLDSQTAWSICSLMKKLTQSGQAIMCTIHQPSALLFQEFDRLLLLKKGGETVYFGDIGPGAATMIDYFERNGAQTKCPPDANPAEWMLRAIGAAPGTKPSQDWFAVWQQSREYQQLHEHLDSLAAAGRQRQTTIADMTPSTSFAAPMSTQVYEVTKRFAQQLWRTPTYIYSKIALCVISPLFVGVTYWKTDNTMQGLQNQMFSMFTVMIVFGPLIEQMMPHFVIQRNIYEKRELPSRTYSWVSFMVSNIMTEIPWQMLMSVFCFLCYYYPVGFYRTAETSERGGMFFLVMWVFFLFASTFGHLLIAAIDIPDTGGSLANLLFILCLIFCGILATPEALPGFWIFMYRVSPLTYIVAALMASGLTNLEIQCAPNEIVHFDSPINLTCGDYMSTFLTNMGGTLLDSTASGTCSYCPMANANDYLAKIHAHLDEGWRNFGIMFAYIAFNIIGAMAIFYFARMPKAPKIKTI